MLNIIRTSSVAIVSMYTHKTITAVSHNIIAIIYSLIFVVIIISHIFIIIIVVRPTLASVLNGRNIMLAFSFDDLLGKLAVTLCTGLG